MAFPATAPILDSLIGSGSPAPRWVTPALAFAANITLTSTGATTDTDGTNGGAVWAIPSATGITAFATIAVPPVTSSGKTVSVGFVNVLAGTSSFQAQFQDGVGLNLTSPGGSGGDGVITTLSPGDGIAVTLNVSGGQAALWHRPVGTPAWVQHGTRNQAFPLRGSQGWLFSIWTNDATCRIVNFGGETLPGADIVTPIVHGHGAA